MVVFSLAVGYHTLFAESGTCGGNLTWNLNDSILTISGSGSMKNYNTSSSPAPWYSIRASINRVIIQEGCTSIGNCAFQNCSAMASITIPRSITQVGYYAFTNCDNLEAVYISDIAAWCNISFEDPRLPNSNPLEKAHHLFYQNNEVTNLVIPDGVSNIKARAFCGCTGLTSIDIPNSVTSIGISAFEGCTNLLFVNIPNSVTNIGKVAFQHCAGLTSVTIPNSITSIGDYAFQFCTGLTSVTISNSITSIGERTFDGCKSLTFIEIPNSVTSIGNEAFRDCIGLTSVVIPTSVKNIGNSAFERCIGLTSIYISDVAAWCSIVFSGYFANPLYYAHNLYLNGELVNEMIIPSDITAIQNYAFYNCTSLVSVDIPENVTSMGSWAFYGCSNLDSLALHCNLEIVGNNVFSNCQNIRYLGICLTDSAPNIKKLFSGSLTKKVKELELFPGSTCCGTPVGGNNHLPFMGNPSVEKITIPANIAVIPDSTFMNCTKLKEVTLGLTEDAGGASTPRRISNAYKDGGTIDGESWDLIQETDVKDEVFKGCSSLSSIYFGRGVKSIGANACENCTTLTRIHLSESLREIHMNAFRNCPLTSLKLPNSINRINQGAFEGCALTEIEIPASMDNAYGLDGRVFANNTDLEKVVINCYADQCRTNSNNRRDQFEGCENIKSITLKTKHDSPALNELFSPTVINNLEELIYLPNTTEIPMMFNSSNCKFSKLKKLVLPEGLQKIWGGNFYGCNNIKLELPSSLNNISGDAFKDCRFNGIVSRAEEAPVLDNDVFLNVSRSTTIGVPDKSKYMNKNIWEEFYLYAKNDHQPTTLATNEVNVTTTNNSATVSYPVAAGGSSASITLASQSTGEEYTYYNTDIPVDEANMPRRAVHLTTRENDMDSFAGYSFTIQSLEANTTYDYTVTIYNSTEEVLAEYTGSFTTLEDEATAIDQISNDPSQLPNKLLRNGQILILRGDHTYTVTGQEVK